LKAQVAIAEATVGKQEADIQDTKQNLANDKRELEALEAENAKLDIRSAATGIIGTLIPALRLPGAVAGAGMSGKATVNDKRIEALKERIQELEARLILLKQDLEAFKARLAELRAKLEECKKSSG